MAKRNFTVKTNRFTTPRRSERVLRRNRSSEPLPPNTPVLNNGPRQVRALRRSSRFSNQQGFVHECEDHPERSVKKSSWSGNCLSDSENLIPKLRKSATVNFHSAQSLRRSQRLLSKSSTVMESDQKTKRVKPMVYSKSNSNVPVKEVGQVLVPNAEVEGGSFESAVELTPEPRKSAALNGDTAQGLRRSQRLLTKSSAVMGSGQKTKKVKSMVYSESNSDVPVNGAGQVLVPNAEEEGGSFELAVELTPEPRKSATRKLMIELTPKRRETATSKLMVELRLEDGERKERNFDKGKLKIDDGERKQRKEDMGKVRVHGKRKRGEESEQVIEGWTKEQVEALRKACLAAKPTPHFWKNVSKMVPGKSAQDCFNRFNSHYSTPPQPKPRSRAKKIKSQFLKQFSLSPSKLLIPTVKGIRSPNLGKAKNYLTRKYIEELQNRCKVDQDHDGDLFSVLEPDVKFSTNILQPSPDLATPKQLKEKPGLLESCSELSSSGHKKSLSRFSKSSLTDLASPAVLKPIKNRLLHEKYIDKLRCRDARRKVEAERAKKSITGKSGNAENKVQKDAVKVARKALLSEARDAINKFKQWQAFIGSSDDDDNDGMGIASTDEDAEDEND